MKHHIRSQSTAVAHREHKRASISAHNELATVQLKHTRRQQSADRTLSPTLTVTVKPQIVQIIQNCSK